MRLRILSVTACLVVALSASNLVADEADPAKKDAEVKATSGSTSPSSGSSSSTSASAPEHARILKDFKSVSGLLQLHHKGNRLYAELKSSDYGPDYIVLISIAKGIGQGSLLGGYSWGFGDDWVWQFRKIDDRVLVIRKNVRFKAKKGSPEESALKNAYTDSVLFSLPITAKGPKGGDLVDLTSVFMSDLPQISMTLPGFAFSSNKSSWAEIKGFKDNLQLQVAATYASSGRVNIETVPDSRGVTINVHYSISKLPTTGYKPREADDRIGYFMTVVKDYSKKSDEDRFMRYVNRWKLEKADASEALSPPKEPIVFWIEKTVPFKYRPAVQAGILEWNKAFEKAGFANAIEVRQQPDDADWDPEDINYNTFRWITSSAGFAMGPSRVNPYNGQILDADIIFDADFLSFWKSEFESLTSEDVAAMTGGPVEPGDALRSPAASLAFGAKHERCMLGHGMARQLAFGATAIVTRADPKAMEAEQEKLIQQGLKEVTMHEVGHTLGLRHNFKGSKMLSLKDINDPDKAKQGIVASVMDYSPTNIVPKGWKQGDYYTTTLGPYDYWAIEYGYKQVSSGEAEALKKIAARSGEPVLAFATDEDTVASDPDPTTNRFDLGDDPLEYAKLQAQLVQELMPTIVDRLVKDGDDYSKARRAFNILLSQHGQSMFFASRYIGGLETSRAHKGDKDGRPPISLVDVDVQREALGLLEQEVFAADPYEFPEEIYGFLASSRWRHWGSSRTTRKDFPIHDYILQWQSRILSQVLSSVTLERIHDTEFKTPADEDVLTTAELIERLTKAIFAELEDVKRGDFTNRKPAISSLRRNLQRSYLRRLSNMSMGNSLAPEDCQTIAYAELASLKTRMSKMLDSKAKLDSYSRAHLMESINRVEKVLDAGLELQSP